MPTKDSKYINVIRDANKDLSFLDFLMRKLEGSFTINVYQATWSQIFHNTILLKAMFNYVIGACYHPAVDTVPFYIVKSKDVTVISDGKWVEERVIRI